MYRYISLYVCIYIYAMGETLQELLLKKGTLLRHTYENLVSFGLLALVGSNSVHTSVISTDFVTAFTFVNI